MISTTPALAGQIAFGFVDTLPTRMPEPRKYRPRIKSTLKPQFYSLDLSVSLFVRESESSDTSDAALIFDHEEDGSIGVETLSYMEGFQPECETFGTAVEREPWTDDGIARMHGVLLDESLKALRGTKNAKQKKEILQWIFEQDSYGPNEETRGMVIRTERIPFTFACCCRLEGIDRDVVRGFINSRLNSLS